MKKKKNRRNAKNKRIAKPRRKPLSYAAIIRIGILVSSLIMAASLSLYLGPPAIQKAGALYRSLSGRLSSHGPEDPAQEDSAQEGGDAVQKADSGKAEQEETEPPGPDDPSVPYLKLSQELGSLEDLTLDKEQEQKDTTYTVMLNTAMGPMLYYNQADSRWGDYLYGGQDPMKKYGCGPTAVAMVIHSFSSTPATPVSAADWAADNGCYAPQGGSYHNLIQDSLSAHGLHVESVERRTAGTVAGLLDSGHILIALMGKGALTDNGHFILITEYLNNGNVRIADPNSYENTAKEWDLVQLMSELKQSRDNGAPLWAVSR